MAGAVVPAVTDDDIVTICFGICETSCSFLIAPALTLIWAGEKVKCDLVSLTFGDNGVGEAARDTLFVFIFGD